MASSNSKGKSTWYCNQSRTPALRRPICSKIICAWPFRMARFINATVIVTSSMVSSLIFDELRLISAMETTRKRLQVRLLPDGLGCWKYCSRTEKTSATHCTSLNDPVGHVNFCNQQYTSSAMVVRTWHYFLVGCPAWAAISQLLVPVHEHSLDIWKHVEIEYWSFLAFCDGCGGISRAWSKLQKAPTRSQIWELFTK